MGDGAAEAEQSSGQRVEVDRVDIAGNRGVAATDISRDAPDRGRRRTALLACGGGSGWVFSLPPCGGGSGCVFSLPPCGGGSGCVFTLPPCGGGSGCVFALPPCGGGSGWGVRCPLPPQVGAGLRPDGFTRNRRIDGHVELPAARLGPKAGCPNP